MSVKKALVLLDGGTGIINEGRVPAPAEFLTRAILCTQSKNISIGLHSDRSLFFLRFHHRQLRLSGPIVFERGYGLVTVDSNSAVDQETFLYNDTTHHAKFQEFEKKLFAEIRSLRPTPALYFDDPEMCVDMLSQQLPLISERRPLVIFNAHRHASSVIYAFYKNGNSLIPNYSLLAEIRAIAEPLFREIFDVPADIYCSEDYCYLLFHVPGTSKRQANPALLSHYSDYQIYMIGHSLNDWLDDNRIIQLGTIESTDEYLAKCEFIGGRMSVSGIADCLKYVRGQVNSKK